MDNLHFSDLELLSKRAPTYPPTYPVSSIALQPFQFGNFRSFPCTECRAVDSNLLFHPSQLPKSNTQMPMGTADSR